MKSPMSWGQAGSRRGYNPICDDRVSRYLLPRQRWTKGENAPHEASERTEVKPVHAIARSYSASILRRSSSRWILYARISPGVGRFGFPVSSSMSPPGRLHSLVAHALRPGRHHLRCQCQGWAEAEAEAEKVVASWHVALLGREDNNAEG
jgi:hypothetical protein